MLTIALSKGRLLQESLKLLAECGYVFDSDIADSRRLIHFTKDRSLKALLIRAKDVPVFVQYGGADMGIVGEDILAEDSPDVYELLRLPFGYCRIVVACPADSDINSKKRGYLRIATKYPNITEKYFASKGVQFEIVKLYGSVELAPHTEIADLIVDLVSTGKTLSENRLKETETIMHSCARLVVNRISFKLRYREIVEFIEKIKARI